MTEATIKSRILEIINAKGITKKEFCEKTGISYSNLKGKSLSSEIGGSIIVKTLKTYNEISAEWLLLGEGTMFRTQPNQIKEKPCGSNKKKNVEMPFEEKNIELLIQEKDARINDLLDHINTLKGQIAILKNR